MENMDTYWEKKYLKCKKLLKIFVNCWIIVLFFTPLVLIIINQEISWTFAIILAIAFINLYPNAKLSAYGSLFRYIKRMKELPKELKRAESEIWRMPKSVSEEEKKKAYYNLERLFNEFTEKCQCPKVDGFFRHEITPMAFRHYKRAVKKGKVNGLTDFADKIFNSNIATAMNAQNSLMRYTDRI